MSAAGSFPTIASSTGNATRLARATVIRVFTDELFGVRGFTLGRVVWALVFVVGFACWSTIANVLHHKGFDATRADFAAFFVVNVYMWFADFFPTMLAVTLADNLPLRGAARIAALTLALAVGAIARYPTLWMLAPDDSWVRFPSWQNFVDVMESWSGFTVVIALAYFSLRRDRKLAAALHAAEVERVTIERRTLESDLQAMQARVEPAFLLHTLRDVARLCVTDPKTSERALEELVIYLRAALPDMRGSSSRLGREIELVRAWLAIVEIRTGARMTFSVDADPDLADAKFPPMTLLPLFASAVPAGVELKGHALTTGIQAAQSGTALRVRVLGTSIGGRSSAMADTLTTARGRLHALYGDTASLEVDTADDDEPAIVLQIPLER